MLKMPDENEEPSSPQTHSDPIPRGGWLRTLLRGKNDNTLRNTLEEYIEDTSQESDETSVSAHEKLLLSNILKLQDLKTEDVMVPRADIVAIEVNTPQEELFALLAEKQFSRIPVYRETMDDVLGAIHIKDVLAATAKNEAINIESMIRDIPIVSPAMGVLDMLLEFREGKKHIALVVDEYGGIDGLVTINDIIETIVGEIDDEHDHDVQAQIVEKPDGSIMADARVDIEDFEERYGKLLTDEEREESDTLGGLVFSLAGRVPARGEVLTHDNGMVFEVVDADPRRVSKLRIRNIPTVLGQ